MAPRHLRPSPLPVSPLRIPSLFPFSDCKVGLFNLVLGPVGKNEKQSWRRGSKERRKVLPADCLQSGHTLVGAGARMNLSLSITRDLVHQEEGVLELHPSCVGHGGVSARSGILFAAGDVGSVCKENEVVQTAGPWRDDLLHKWRNRRMNTDGGSDGNSFMEKGNHPSTHMAKGWTCKQPPRSGHGGHRRKASSQGALGPRSPGQRGEGTCPGSLGMACSVYKGRRAAPRPPAACKRARLHGPGSASDLPLTALGLCAAFVS
ncbi:uncharacterized protein LOC112412081 isoform X1 [Neophocaena asiaeorientalis asiaeorientalis]|uniref:Uncharacterized protein LOC112412081 isoform X1 n=1 Tax=Neophocaena asiaeorientalis asiaeorientalis TaxID=1706337 RepID=A0A341CX62_NEOAA|nr:uncharacterized protein LOC112412081 isoform X1 [Neophocaena asiaeorientalis asiaeorientalis]